MIQHVIKHGKPKDRNVLMEEVHKNLLAYSQHKFASNVVEKCLQFGTLKERAYIIDHVFTENAPGMRDGQKNILQTMVCDPYANYVVQKMLDVATPEQHCAIIAEIKAHSTQVRERESQETFYVLVVMQHVALSMLLTLSQIHALITVETFHIWKVHH